MGVYWRGELEHLSLESLTKMRDIHKSDLIKYHSTESYPNKERDINETKQNISVLDEEIKSRKV